MAAFRTGDTLVWIIGPVQDDAGLAVTGAAWSAVVARRPDGTTFSPTYTEIPNTGDYLATVVSTMRGLWFLHSTATVSGVVYTDADKFTVDDDGMTPARAAKLDSLGAAGVAFLPGPVEVNGVRTIYKRTDYKNVDSRSLDWTTADDGTWPDLTGATIAFVARPIGGDATLGITVAGVVVTPTGTKQVRVEIPHAATIFTKPGSQSYQLRATLSNGDVIPLATGELRIVDYLGGA